MATAAHTPLLRQRALRDLVRLRLAWRGVELGVADCELEFADGALIGGFEFSDAEIGQLLGGN